MLEIDTPHPIRSIRIRRVGSRGFTGPFAAGPDSYLQVFFAPQPPNLLPVDPHAFVVTQTRPGASVTLPRVLAGIVTQPLPQLSIGIIRRICEAFVSLRRSWLPDDLTSEALRETERFPQRFNCSSFGSRA
jgi:hypothetical protein